MRCQFCNMNEAITKITDSETLQEVNICCECNKGFDVEPIGYNHLTIQEVERGIDEIVDNQIDEMKLQRVGIEI